MILCGGVEQPEKKNSFQLQGFVLIAEGFGRGREILAQLSEAQFASAQETKGGFVIGTWADAPDGGVIKQGPVPLYETNYSCTETGCHAGERHCRFKSAKLPYPHAVAELKKLEKIKTPGFEKPVLPDNGIAFRLAFDALTANKVALAEMKSIPSRFVLDGAGAEDYDQAMDLIREAADAGCGR